MTTEQMTKWKQLRSLNAQLMATIQQMQEIAESLQESEIRKRLHHVENMSLLVEMRIDVKAEEARWQKV